MTPAVDVVHHPWRSRAGVWDPQTDCSYFEDFHNGVPYSLDTFFAVTTVDQQGRESRLSAPGFVACDEDSIKLTMDLDGAYITVAGGGCAGCCGGTAWPARSLRRSNRDFPEYTPAFWGLTMPVPR